jgi:hypothetical protein
MTTNFNYQQGLPPLPGRAPRAGRAQAVHPVSNDLQPLQRAVIDAIEQGRAVATANVDRYAQRRLERAEQLSQRARLEALAGVLNTALWRLWALAWEEVDGVPVGFDAQGTLAVGVPWSWRSGPKYGLRRGQSMLLARFVKEWTAMPLDAHRWTPIYFAPKTTRWCVNTRDFATFGAGVDIMAHAVTAAALARLERG